ncbi:MAG: hypothetical protein PWR24_582 [Desulfonauticus sp.]|nr:MAG: hypothetical protein XD41_1860 [Desulfonauticus sp. 38_4375]MDK2921025.1 hypothetical protein [Desulfonauticus sp.]
MALLSKWLSKARENYLQWKKAFFLFLALLVLVNIFLRPHHPHFSWEKLPGFWACFGLVGTFLLVKLAKGCAHTFLGKDEDFYER